MAPGIISPAEAAALIGDRDVVAVGGIQQLFRCLHSAHLRAAAPCVSRGFGRDYGNPKDPI